MGYRPVNDPYNGIEPIADKLIGNAYDTVRTVATNIAVVKHVSANLEMLSNLDQALDDVITVANDLELISQVADTATLASAAAAASAASAATSATSATASAASAAASLAGIGSANAATATALSAGADRTKLDGIAAGATVNSSDATLLARANHTGTQLWSTLTATPTTLTGYGILDAQPLDSDLTAVAGLATAGLIARTGSGTATTRTLTAPASGVTVTNGDGVSGNPTLVLANDLAAVEGLAGTGFAVRTASDTWTNRTVTGTAGRITLTDGDGVSGNPTIDLTSGIASAGTYRSVTVDTYGRITAGTNPTTISGYGLTDAAPIASPAFTGTPTTAGDMGFGGAALNNSSYSTITIRGTDGGVLELTGPAGVRLGRFYADYAANSVYLLNSHASGPLIFGAGAGERARISAVGDFYVGQSSTQTPGNGNTTVGSVLRAGGRLFINAASGDFSNWGMNGTGTLINFASSNTIVGSISISGAATSYNTTSDYRLKDNVIPLADGLAQVNRLKPSRFTFKSDPSQEVIDGFIAHEVQEVYAPAVTGLKDAVDETGVIQCQAMDAGKLIPMLVAALQELHARHEAALLRIEALEGVVALPQAAGP